MRIGLVTDSLGQMPLAAMLAEAAAQGITALEFGCGNWSSAPHLDLARLLESAPARAEFLAALRDHAMVLAALNCSGNPLHPGAAGAAHMKVTQDTMRLAGLLGVEKVVLMSGLPGGGATDAEANWITTAWPPETARILAWQWERVIIPTWRDLARDATAAGLRLCLELHGHQAVFNVATLLRLRAEVGPAVGANLDPSHLFWMGADPLAAALALGAAIHHVHAKDTAIDAARAAVNGLIDTTPMGSAARAWRYVTLGDGHGEAWWRGFIAALRTAGYNDTLAIEHEDVARTPQDGVRRSVELLRRVV